MKRKNTQDTCELPPKDVGLEELLEEMKGVDKLVFFLNRYDFAYAGRDTVNQLGKIAPGVIKIASGQIDEIAKKRIEQINKEGQRLNVLH